LVRIVLTKGRLSYKPKHAEGPAGEEAPSSEVDRGISGSNTPSTR